MSEITGNTDEREAVARALCELHIRNVRRHDTDATTIEAVLPGAIEMHWFDFQLEADAALSALAPIRAAEILAAEANERARIVASLRASEAKAEPSHRDRWWVLKCIADAIERNEHGAGK